jgi:lysophospholipid acyltransferase (LPLAT)-like uncharacterized protein
LWLKTLRLRWPAGDRLPQGAVIALWHEHLPILIRAFSGLGIHVLISRSADGEWAARACRRFGYRVHRGSSSRALEGLRALARAAGEGPALIGMALDGPRGPRRRPKPGTLWLSRRLDVPVVPVAVSARRAFRLGSWDRALVPWPFSTVEIRLGAPVRADTLGEIEAAMRAAEANALAPAGTGSGTTGSAAGAPSGGERRASGE